MADYPKDQSKIPGGLAGGAASAARPASDRRESSRKAAETRYRDQVGPRIPGEAGQPQDYNAELRGSTWKIERDEQKGVQQQLRVGDQEADAVNAARDRADQDYNPENPREEDMEREFRGE